MWTLAVWKTNCFSLQRSHWFFRVCINVFNISLCSSCSKVPGYGSGDFGWQRNDSFTSVDGTFSSARLEWSKAITMIDSPCVRLYVSVRICTCLFVYIASTYTHKHALFPVECAPVTVSDNLCCGVCSFALCRVCVCTYGSLGPGHNGDGWSVCVEAVIICYVSGCVWQPLWAVHLLCELRGRAGGTAVRIDLAARFAVCRNKSSNS